ncbi:MAG: FmdB family zinc ribbon protein [Deltaproteobacteria bacterium]
MPIYEYDCPSCGRIEVAQRITEAPLRRCNECRRKVRRLISNSSFTLKGSGWYATDYASPAASKPSGSSSPAQP